MSTKQSLESLLDLDMGEIEIPDRQKKDYRAVTPEEYLEDWKAFEALIEPLIHNISLQGVSKLNIAVKIYESFQKLAEILKQNRYMPAMKFRTTIDEPIPGTFYYSDLLGHVHSFLKSGDRFTDISRVGGLRKKVGELVKASEENKIDLGHIADLFNG